MPAKFRNPPSRLKGKKEAITVTPPPLFHNPKTLNPDNSLFANHRNQPLKKPHIFFKSHILQFEGTHSEQQMLLCRTLHTDGILARTHRCTKHCQFLPLLTQ